MKPIFRKITYFLVTMVILLPAFAFASQIVLARQHENPAPLPYSQTTLGDPDCNYLDAPETITQALPRKICVGVYVLNLGDLDLTTGSDTMDFYLTFTCDQGFPCDPTNFDVMNGEMTFSEDQTSTGGRPDINGEATATDDMAKRKWYAYRVRSNLLTNLDLKKYPFDEQTLYLAIEDKINNDEKLVYITNDNETGIDQAASISGWSIRKDPAGAYQWKSQIAEHHYDVFGSSYSRYEFFIVIYRPWLSAFLKGLFPAIVIVFVGMLSFAMRHDAVTDRLALTSSTLVGAILYHLTLTSSIPPVGYLTYADEFMIVCYLAVSVALAISVLLLIYRDRSEESKAIKLHMLTRWTVPLSWVAMLGLLTVYEFWIVNLF